MAPFKSPLDEVKRAREQDAEIRAAQPLIDQSEFRKLEHQLEDAASRAQKLVTGVLLSGDDVQATPTPRRHIPEHDDAASAGRRGVGVGQHLYAVPAEVVQIGYGRTLKARRQGRLPFPRPTGGSAA